MNTVLKYRVISSLLETMKSATLMFRHIYSAYNKIIQIFLAVLYLLF